MIWETALSGFTNHDFILWINDLKSRRNRVTERALRKFFPAF